MNWKLEWRRLLSYDIQFNGKVYVSQFIRVDYIACFFAKKGEYHKLYIFLSNGTFLNQNVYIRTFNFGNSCQQENSHNHHFHIDRHFLKGFLGYFCFSSQLLNIIFFFSKCVNFPLFSLIKKVYGLFLFNTARREWLTVLMLKRKQIHFVVRRADRHRNCVKTVADFQTNFWKFKLLQILLLLNCFHFSLINNFF